MLCPFCESELRQEGGGNIAIHFTCLNGCGAWWPEEDRTDESALEIWNAEQAYKKSMVKKGGGGGSSGRLRKKPQKIDMSGKYWLPETTRPKQKEESEDETETN